MGFVTCYEYSSTQIVFNKLVGDIPIPRLLRGPSLQSAFAPQVLLMIRYALRVTHVTSYALRVIRHALRVICYALLSRFYTVEYDDSQNIVIAMRGKLVSM